MMPVSPKLPVWFGSGPAPSASTSVTRIVIGPAGQGFGRRCGWIVNCQPSLPAVVRAVATWVCERVPSAVDEPDLHDGLQRARQGRAADCRVAEATLQALIVNGALEAGAGARRLGLNELDQRPTADGRSSWLARRGELARPERQGEEDCQYDRSNGLGQPGHDPHALSLGADDRVPTATSAESAAAVCTHFPGNANRNRRGNPIELSVNID